LWHRFLSYVCKSTKGVLVASFNILSSNLSGWFMLVFYCFRS